MKVVCKEQSPEATNDTPKQDTQITWEEHLEREAEIAEQFTWEAFKLAITKADEAVKATEAAKIRELKAFHNKAMKRKAWKTAAKLKELHKTTGRKR